LDRDCEQATLQRHLHKKVFEASQAQIHEAFRALVKRAIKSGDIRKDLDPIDLLAFYRPLHK
jgi:hypothetical protein